MLDLESSSGEPVPEDWSTLRQLGIERSDYQRSWKFVKRMLAEHRTIVRERMELSGGQ